VPGDPSQVIYVWWDALGNYLTALGYGTDPAEYERWWGEGAGRRLHLLGKGVLRFHAVYWPAMLLSAGLPLPTDLFVHDYLTAGGRKISKSGGPVVPGPADLAADYGVDAVRWWLLREVPRVGDADFTVERLVARADDELANGIGNLVNRVVAMIHRYRGGNVPEGGQSLVARSGVAARVDAALSGFDFRAATAAVWAIADQANRSINEVRPWQLAREPGAASRLDAVLSCLYETCLVLAAEIAPFLPDAAARISAQLTPDSADAALPRPSPVFRRLAAGKPA
jgi:methionyl-tRNA synthetase